MVAATRSPAPASPAKVSLRPPLASASSWTSEKMRPAAAPARLAPRAAAAAEPSAAAFLAHAASSAPVTSSVRLDGQAAGLQDLTQWAAQVGVAGRHHHGGAHLDRLARVRGSPEAGDGARRHALGHIRGRRGSERRHQALRGDEHRAAFPDARADLADRGGQGAAGHGHHDKVDAARTRSRSPALARSPCRAGHRVDTRCSRGSGAGARPERPSGSRAGPRGRHAPARTPSRCPWSPRRPRPRSAAAAARRATPTATRRTARCARSPRSRGRARGRPRAGR